MDSGLLASIRGFKKQGLAKSVTVDKSGPLISGNSGNDGSIYVSQCVCVCVWVCWVCVCMCSVCSCVCLGVLRVCV